MNAYIYLALIFLLAPTANADSQGIEVVYYTPVDEMGYPAVSLATYPEDGYPVTVSELEIAIYYGNEQKEVLKLKEDLELPPNGGDNYVNVQIEKPSSNFAKGRYDVYSIIVTGRLYPGDTATNTYRPIERLEWWDFTPGIRGNLTFENQSVEHGDAFGRNLTDEIILL